MHITNITTSNYISFGKGLDKSQTDFDITSARKSSANLLVATLMALATLSPIKTEAQTAFNRTDSEVVDDNNLTMGFEDKDGYVDMNDFTYSSEKSKRTAQTYIKGLKPYQGKKWTQALEDMSNNIVHFFNRSNTYAYDLNTDELVKDNSIIKYRPDGRISSIMLTDAISGETIDKITYKYDKNGNIDSSVRLGGVVTEYRKDGTRFSVVADNGDNDRREYYYNRNGNLVGKKIKNGDTYTEIKFDNEGNIVTKFVKNSFGAVNQVYNNGDLMFETRYDSKDKVISYRDNYFRSIQDRDLQLASAYFNKKITSHQTGENESYKYPNFYRTEPVDGRIVNPVRQGTTGTCYIAGVINSFAHIPAGRAVLDEVFDNDTYNDRSIVNLYGVNRQYNFNKGYIYKNISRLGRKDGDYSAFVKAYESFRQENLTEEEESKLPSDFFTRGEKGRMVDSGFPTEVFYAITGKYMSQSGNKITDADILKAKACLDTNRGIVNAGTVSGKDKHREIPQEDAQRGITNSHNLSVWDIDLERGYVTLYDSVTENEIRYPIAKFKKYFSKLYWATLD